MTYRILFISPNTRNAIHVRKPLDVTLLLNRSRYECQLDPGDHGSGSLWPPPGVDGLDCSRDETRGEVEAI